MLKQSSSAKLELRFDVEQVIDLIDQFNAEEKLRIRRYLDQDWARQLSTLLDRIQARVPEQLGEAEVAVDVAEAIREVRAGN